MISGPASLESTEPIFVTEPEDEGSGDYIDDWGSEPFTDCGENLDEQSGVIRSPWYPDNYPNNADCYWHIIVATGRKVYLNFTIFDVSQKENL